MSGASHGTGKAVALVRTMQGQKGHPLCDLKEDALVFHGLASNLAATLFNCLATLRHGSLLLTHLALDLPSVCVVHLT